MFVDLSDSTKTDKFAKSAYETDRIGCDYLFQIELSIRASTRDIPIDRINFHKFFHRKSSYAMHGDTVYPKL